MVSRKGKARQHTHRVSPSPDNTSEFGYGANSNNLNQSASTLDMGLNPSYSSDASFGVQLEVPSMQPYHNIPPNSNSSFAPLHINTTYPNFNFPPFPANFGAANSYFSSLNPNSTQPNSNMTPPTPNFAFPFTAPDIAAPRPRLPHNIAALELSSYRGAPFVRQWTIEARSARSHPYNSTAHHMSSCDDISQPRQVEFEGEIPTFVRGSEIWRRIMPPSLDGASLRDGPCASGTFNSGTFDTCQTDKSSKTPKDATASKAAQVLSNAISDQVRERLKCSLLNENLMLHGDLLSLMVNDILVSAVMGQINDQVLAEQWVAENAQETKKNLRMVPVNLQNEIKRLACTIVLCSWGLSPGLDEQVQDIIACRRARIEALIQTYDHVDSPMVPFGHAAVTQMVQAIIRQFRCYLPEDNDEINFNNIVTFVVTMLHFALREFSEGKYNQSEFVVEDEETAYDKVLDRINELHESDLEFYHLIIDHIFKLL
ncbi:hypothetical protein F4604DRAFT_1924950 [Suillus subluteus]|nr:hypothetical protein F4604DRAFT_1924950 [Suillus subluteus]